MASINLQPQALDLAMYSGDGFSFKLVCTDAANAPIDMGGDVAAQVRIDRTSPDDPPVAEFDVNMTDAFQGIIVLSLTGAQTQAMTDDFSTTPNTFVGVWDCQWTPADGEPRTICQGKVECVVDVTR